MYNWHHHVLNAVGLAVTVITDSKIHRQKYPLSPLKSTFWRTDGSREVGNGGEKPVVDLAASECCLWSIFSSWQKDGLAETLSVTVESTLLVNMPKRRFETAKYACSPAHVMPERSVSLCSHLQKEGKISKEKLRELLLPLTTKQTVSPHLSTPFWGNDWPFSPPYSGRYFPSTLLSPASLHHTPKRWKTGYEDVSFRRVYAVYRKRHLIIGRWKTWLWVTRPQWQCRGEYQGWLFCSVTHFCLPFL